MNKTDTFERETVYLTLDKPYILRITMKVIYELEKIYISMRNALDCLYGSDSEVKVVAVINFLHVLTGTSKSHIEECLTIENLLDALVKIQESLSVSFPDYDENRKTDSSPYESNNWDDMYFIARYRLMMSDLEFWDCVPRRFDKLHYLWLYERGEVEAEPSDEFLDNLDW